MFGWPPRSKILYFFLKISFFHVLNWSSKSSSAELTFASIRINSKLNWLRLNKASSFRYNQNFVCPCVSWLGTGPNWVPMIIKKHEISKIRYHGTSKFILNIKFGFYGSKLVRVLIFIKFKWIWSQAKIWKIRFFGTSGL